MFGERRARAETERRKIQSYGVSLAANAEQLSRDGYVAESKQEFSKALAAAAGSPEAEAEVYQHAIEALGELATANPAVLGKAFEFIGRVDEKMRTAPRSSRRELIEDTLKRQRHHLSIQLAQLLDLAQAGDTRVYEPATETKLPSVDTEAPTWENDKVVAIHAESAETEQPTLVTEVYGWEDGFRFNWVEPTASENAAAL